MVFLYTFHPNTTPTAFAADDDDDLGDDEHDVSSHIWLHECPTTLTLSQRAADFLINAVLMRKTAINKLSR